MEQEPKLKKVTPGMRLRLRAPLPAEAVKQNPSKTFLSTIKPIFVTERLNEVFGIGSWQIRTDIVSPVAAESKESKSRKYTEFTSLMKTTLTIPEYGIYYECIAGSSNEDEGDATKGGTTDGITKIASWMEIGINVFKGLGNVQTEPSIEEGVSAILAAKSREEIATTWKQYPHLKSVEAFKNAAKAMSALYPSEEAKPVEQPQSEPETAAGETQPTSENGMPEDVARSVNIVEKALQKENNTIPMDAEQKKQILDLLKNAAQTQEIITKVTTDMAKYDAKAANQAIRFLKKKIAEKAVETAKMKVS